MTLFVSENDKVDKHRIFVKPTVPIVCETNQPCYLNVGFGGATFRTQQEVLSSKCGVRFDERNWDTFQFFEIAGVRDQVEDGQSSQKIKVSATYPLQDLLSKKIANEWFQLPDQYIEVRLRVQVLTEVVLYMSCIIQF